MNLIEQRVPRLVAVEIAAEPALPGRAQAGLAAAFGQPFLQAHFCPALASAEDHAATA